MNAKSKHLTGHASYKHFAGFPFAMLESSNYSRLTAFGKALLLDLRSQFKGSQNGNIDATWSRLSQQNCWRSKGTLNWAIQELLHYGFITRTQKGKRLGGTHFPSLYALTWEPINELPRQGIRGTTIASHEWQTPKSVWQRSKRSRKRKTPATPTVLERHVPTTPVVLGQHFRFTTANETTGFSQVRQRVSQVRLPYSLNKLAIGPRVYLSNLSRHIAWGRHELTGMRRLKVAA